MSQELLVPMGLQRDLRCGLRMGLCSGGEKGSDISLLDLAMPLLALLPLTSHGETSTCHTIDPRFFQNKVSTMLDNAKAGYQHQWSLAGDVGDVRRCRCCLLLPFRSSCWAASRFNARLLSSAGGHTARPAQQLTRRLPWLPSRHP